MGYALEVDKPFASLYHVLTMAHVGNSEDGTCWNDVTEMRDQVLSGLPMRRFWNAVAATSCGTKCAPEPPAKLENSWGFHFCWPHIFQSFPIPAATSLGFPNGRWPTEVVRTLYPGPLERNSARLGWNMGQAGTEDQDSRDMWHVNMGQDQEVCKTVKTVK